MSQVKRVFLGWKQPALRSSVEYLFERFTSNGFADLTKVTIVTPTQRAGRRLRELVVEHADVHRLAFFPPQITTAGQLPELLYENRQPFAPPLLQQFAWTNALKQVDRAKLEQIVPVAPDSDTDPRWLELGSMLQRQHIELTDNGLDFATVAEEGRKTEGFTDFARWKALASVQDVYLASFLQNHLHASFG